jgi:hypothetical protein
MPQILKTKDELRRMILDEIRSYVVCPEGTDVTSRADSDYGWIADVAPTPGSLIVHADCDARSVGAGMTLTGHAGHWT